MKIPIKKILLEAIQNNTKNITVYGESHFHRDEVDRIRNDIIKLKPDIIIHELPEDYKFYKIHLPSTRFYQLERGLDQNIYKYFKGDYVIAEITHKINRASYMTNFMLIKKRIDKNYK